MDEPPPRIVTLVLVDARGNVLGALLPFEAETPWWMDMAPVVRAAQACHGVRVTVLRLLRAEQEAGPGGGVTYLAELDAGSRHPPVQAWAGALPDHPRRLPYARTGGPRADLAWAAAVLNARGAALTGEPMQIRTWNLSSVWRLPTTLGPAWLKVVPPFFAHEGGILAALVDAPVPRLLGHGGGRVLLADVEGDDLYGAALPQCLRMIELLVELQQTWLGRADELRSLGLPDWRGPALSLALAALVERRGGELESDERALLGAFADDLPRRFTEIAACGIADGIVHGDFHPGNFRGSAQCLTLLDWGDSGLGHPLLDQPAFLDRMPREGVAAARAHWAALWRRALPHADIERAVGLLAPVASARQALIYQCFLDAIEDTEHPYHRADVAPWLQRTAERLRLEARR